MEWLSPSGFSSSTWGSALSTSFQPPPQSDHFSRKHSAPFSDLVFTSKSGGPGQSRSACVSHCAVGPAPSPLSSLPGQTASAVAVSPPGPLWESPCQLAQKHRGQDIFSLQSGSIQTIRSLRPLIAQVREGKVTAVQEGSSCLIGSGLL